MSAKNENIKSNDLSYYDQDELTIKDIVIFIRDYIVELKAKWKWVAFITLPITFLFAFNAYVSEIYYPSNVTFLVNEDNSGGDGLKNIKSLLGAFGGGATEESALEKVIALFQSRKIIENTLFQKTTIKGKEDYVANHMITEYGTKRLLSGYNSGWADELEEKVDFKFTHSQVDSFDRTENLFLKVLYEKIVGNENLGIDPIVTSSIDAKSGIMKIGLFTASEDLTYEVLLLLYNQLSQYYINKTIEHQLKIYNISSFKRDSLSIALKIADRKQAEFIDGNRNLVWVRGELEKSKLQREARISELLYADAIRQTEMADFALRQKTPYVQLIDKPARPILPRKSSVKNSIVLGTVSWRISQHNVHISKEVLS